METDQEVLISSWRRDSEEEDAGGETVASSSFRRRRGSKRSTSTSRDTAASSKRSRSLRNRGDSMMAGHCSEQTEFDSLCEGFLDCISGPHVIHGKSKSVKEMWVNKHRPLTIPELSVHKKKVEEVRVWLEERINAPKDDMRNKTLLVTGQAGVGKSAVIHVIASELEAELCEWKTPTPTLWKEHLHNSNSGVSYVSKLDEFETFVDTVRRYPVLSSVHVNGSRKPIIVLIDDLPVTNGKVTMGRLCECLRVLTCSSQVPTIILVTEYSREDSNDVRGCHVEEVLSTIERAGAHKVCFNPVTVNSIRKTLSSISQKEEYNVPEETLNQIAKLSQGDIRHAITSLQYFSLNPEKSKKFSYHPGESFDLSGRDETLSLFHALGKFLHNKRVDRDPPSLGVQSGITLQRRFLRPLLKMDAPEDILSQAHAVARPVVDFLHENVLDFLGDESADDAWIIASYLSDADCLLSTRAQMLKGITHGHELLSQFAAASVAVRGVLFGNTHPSSSRWRSIRRPRLWQTERLSGRNKAITASERVLAQCGVQSYVSTAELVAEIKPAMRWLGLVDFRETARHDGDDDDDDDDDDDIQEW